MKEQINICGAGLVGSLLAIFLIQKGYRVRVFEKRKDPRITSDDAGRSINLAISHRGLHALKDALPELDLRALDLAVPMFGRAIHDEAGAVVFQAYGEASQHINSIGRSELNILLISKAASLGVEFLFAHTSTEYDATNKQWTFNDALGNATTTQSGEIVIGADGAFSVVRKQLLDTVQKQAQIDTLDYGYKELEIKVPFSNKIATKEALHIWPRERFMLIALPNKDGSYTATLFLPMEGELSFKALSTNEKIRSFFNTYFSDTLELIPDLEKQFEQHPTSRLATIHTATWYNDHTLLIGDAAHALVPFYGQGMNAGFEDCRILSEIIDKKGATNWEQVFAEFFTQRKKNTDAISDLALQNFVEMRDHVADASFLVRKKIEKFLHQQLQERFVPQYTLVSFSDTPYSNAKDVGVLHAGILDEIMALPGIEVLWPSEELEKKVIKIAEPHIIS
ncbi:FAD-dependent oxidoreductase [Cytophaga aurantiaca]|uniref:FAD-dependent oxidoreductase n=1 Tax=Cytophaga aurantiaca TaxID=29530 RepID=UPI000380C734|nr:NAD(P)/FAD-dependent oxidoreductase [Cytophaga aurantiaca]